MTLKITDKQKKAYGKIIEDATVDCYDEHEQISGWTCLLGDCIKTPCKCIIGNEKAVLKKIDTDDTGGVVIGVVKLNNTKLRVPIQDIALNNPKAMQYICAYKYWCKNG